MVTVTASENPVTFSPGDAVILRDADDAPRHGVVVSRSWCEALGTVVKVNLRSATGVAPSVLLYGDDLAAARLRDAGPAAA